MKPGDLVRINPPTIETPRSIHWVESRRGKIGMIIGYTEGHERFHPYYRLWKVLLEGKSVTIQGMNLAKI